MNDLDIIRLLYKTGIKYIKLLKKFNNYLEKKGVLKTFNDIYYDKKKIIKSPDENLMKVIEKRGNKLFIPLNLIFLEVILLLKKNPQLKIVGRVNINNYQKLLKNKNKNLKLILIEFIKIKKRINYFVSYRYLNEDIFLLNTTIKNQYYNRHRNHLSNDKCYYSNCANDEEKKLLIKTFIQQKNEIIRNKNKKLKLIAYANFIKSQLFRDYYECIYKNCIKTFIPVMKSQLIYNFSIFCIKNNCDLKSFEKIKNNFKSLSTDIKLNKITSFEIFLKIVIAYIKFSFDLLK